MISNYVCLVAGHRTVPVEVTTNTYLTEDANQKLILLNEFITDYIATNGASDRPIKGYLAQFALFEHIPDLRKDICIPDFCEVILEEDKVQEDSGGDGKVQEESEGEDSIDPLIQSWFGPIGMYYCCE